MNCVYLAVIHNIIVGRWTRNKKTTVKSYTNFNLIMYSILKMLFIIQLVIYYSLAMVTKFRHFNLYHKNPCSSNYMNPITICRANFINIFIYTIDTFRPICMYPVAFVYALLVVTLKYIQISTVAQIIIAILIFFFKYYRPNNIYPT